MDEHKGKVNTADSWKTDGNCEVCRRRDYCGKKCSAHKNAERHFRKAVLNGLRASVFFLPKYLAGSKGSSDGK